MKAKLLSVVFLLFSLWGNTQSNLQLDSTHYFLWDTANGTYGLSERGFFETGANDSITQQLYLKFNGSSWVNDRKDIFTYDADNRRTEWLRQAGNATGWQNDWRWFFSYDVAGNNTLRSDEAWNGSTWDGHTKNTYSYDINNRQTEWLIQTRDGTGWTNSNRYTYTYNTNGQQTEYILENWNGSAWNVISRSEFTYDPNDNPVLELRQMWTGTGWQNSVRLHSTFDQYGRRTSIVIESWNGSQWVNYQRQFHEWHPSGARAIVSWVRQTGYNTPDWVNIDSTYHYLSTKTSGIKQVAGEFEVQVSPNPNNGIFNIEIPGFGTPIDIKVLNTEGQTVHTSRILSKKTSINLSGEAPGVYMLHLRSGKDVVRETIVIR